MIDRFTGEYEFLSNFYPSMVMLHDEVYDTVEHAFQAAKSNDPSIRAAIARCTTPGKAKRMGRTVRLRPEWEEKWRLPVMEHLLRQKFHNNPLRAWLKATRPHELVEGNTWNDRFWGVCAGEGENHLGRLLMKIRDEL